MSSNILSPKTHKEFLMKKAAFLLLAALTASFGQAVIAPPLYSSPSITFYDNGSAPTVYGIPAACQAVTIQYNTAQKTIQSLDVRGDSLIISTLPVDTPYYPLAQSSDMVAPIYVGPRVVFDQMGTYQAYEHDLSQPVILIYPPPPPVLVPLGEFEILPLLEVQPAGPTVEDVVTLNLYLGQTNGDPCVAYSGTATVKDSAVFLTWQELGLGRACLDTVYDTPVKYGPSFNLGTLSQGKYSVFIEDTVNVGSFAVSGILVVNGSVTIMKHPLSRMMSIPVPGALVTAIKAPHR
jgi:hypothetical protein